jgi:cytidine deaminase
MPGGAKIGRMELEGLVSAAREARANAYAPYSKFRVGAAVMGLSGRIYVGCNVENASYGATVCAERAAICSMVASGESRLTAVAIFTDADPAASPCGICRQVLAEFADDAPIVVASPRQQSVLSLAALLPGRFVFNQGTILNG